MTIKIEVGMQLYYHRSDSRMHGKDEIKTVTKVGKKYFYLDEDICCCLVGTERNDSIIAFQVVKAGANGNIYWSKEDWEMDEYWKKLCYALPYENVSEKTKKELIAVFKKGKKEEKGSFFTQKQYLYNDPTTKDEFLSLNAKSQVSFEEYQDGKMKFVGKDVNNSPLSIYVHLNGVSATLSNEMTIQEIEDIESKYDVVTENYIL